MSCTMVMEATLIVAAEVRWGLVEVAVQQASKSIRRVGCVCC